MPKSQRLGERRERHTGTVKEMYADSISFFVRVCLSLYILQTIVTQHNDTQHNKTLDLKNDTQGNRTEMRRNNR
jgi:hypothetical protein